MSYRRTNCFQEVLFIVDFLTLTRNNRTVKIKYYKKNNMSYKEMKSLDTFYGWFWPPVSL